MIRVAISTSISRTWIEERGYQVGRYIIIIEEWRRKSQREEESESRRISRFKGRRLVGWIEISR